MSSHSRLLRGHRQWWALLGFGAAVTAAAAIGVLAAADTPEEYAGQTGMPKLGWGHSTFEEAVKLAKAANVKKLVLYHHDPMRSDEGVLEIETNARGLFRASVAAREGMQIDLRVGAAGRVAA